MTGRMYVACTLITLTNLCVLERRFSLALQASKLRLGGLVTVLVAQKRPRG